MIEMPASVRPALRRLARRLALGLFLDTWPMPAAASLLLAGLVVLTCRLFVPGAGASLQFLWLAPLLAAVPVLIVCFARAYRPGEIVALADSLSGGQGMLLTLHETNDAAWTGSPLLQETARLALPRIRPWRKLAVLPPSLVFLATVLLLPQRAPAHGASAALADDVVADLAATVSELKQEKLITTDEEKRLEEEIERVRRSVKERVDAGSWEAADTLRDNIATGLSAKQDALKWAAESVERYAAAARSGAGAGSPSEAAGAELTKALEKLAQSGLLAGAPTDVQSALKSGRLPADAAALRKLTASLSRYLAETNGRFRDLSRPGKEFGRFDPSEFPVESDALNGQEGTEPGRGGIDRGRADAPLTWGKESLPFDRFRADALPPGAARGPDDWAPLVELPGAPQQSPSSSVASVGRQYAAAAGQSAWRRTLAPRHQSAVKKYFEK
jgi:hypothetical protein